MRIGIIGPGAIGSWLGARLAARGHRLSALARGATLAALDRDGWRLAIGGREVSAPVVAAANAAALGPQDLLLITLKGPALAAVAPRLAPMIGPETLIVPMMNGVPWWFLLAGGGELGPTPLHSVDAGGDIAKALPYAQVMGSVVHASATLSEPGFAMHNAGNRLIFGEPAGGHSARLEALCWLFADAGFEAEASTSIRYDIWYKLWGNMTMNPISAVTGALSDGIVDDPLVARFILAVMAEAQAIGARIGCAISEKGEDRMAVTRKLGAFKTSMLQDADAGRPLEIDQILSAPREIAERFGMETPMLDALTGLTRLYARSHDLYDRTCPRRE